MFFGNAAGGALGCLDHRERPFDSGMEQHGADLGARLGCSVVLHKNDHKRVPFPDIAFGRCCLGSTWLGAGAAAREPQGPCARDKQKRRGYILCFSDRSYELVFNQPNKSTDMSED